MGAGIKLSVRFIMLVSACVICSLVMRYVSADHRKGSDEILEYATRAWNVQNAYAYTCSRGHLHKTHLLLIGGGFLEKDDVRDCAELDYLSEEAYTTFVELEKSYSTIDDPIFFKALLKMKRWQGIGCPSGYPRPSFHPEVHDILCKISALQDQGKMVTLTGDVKEELESAYRMIPTSGGYDHYLTEIGEIYMRGGEERRGLKVLRDIRYDFLRDRVLMSLAQTLCAQGNYNKAFEWIEKMETVVCQVRGLSFLARAYHKEGISLQKNQRQTMERIVERAKTRTH